MFKWLSLKPLMILASTGSSEMYTSPASPCGRPMRRDAHISIRSRTRKAKLAGGERAGRKNRLMSVGFTILKIKLSAMQSSCRAVVLLGSREPPADKKGRCLGAAACKHALHAQHSLSITTKVRTARNCQICIYS